MFHLKKNLKWFVREGLFSKSPFIGRLTNRFLDKARNNLVTMSILFNIPQNQNAIESLSIPRDYDSSGWVAVCGYYAMYMASLGALAKVGYRSKNHVATVLALEKFFVKKEMLEAKYIRMLEHARLEKEQIEQLKLAKERREIAQYSVTKETTRHIAKQIKSDAYQFVERIEELIERINTKKVT